MTPRSRWLSVLLLAAFAMPFASGDAAANFVNGNFESGTLSGWHVNRVTEAGNWFAYEGTDAPIGSHRSPPADPVQAPPQGSYAAVTDEADPDTLILYQDVAVEAGASHLSLRTYYNSYSPIAIPAPDTLSVDEEVLGGQQNQQFRIDVMRPGAPLESLDPADILSTAFETRPGAPENLPPTRVTADLTPFVGQTVRLRIANAVHEEVFNAGVDAIAMTTAAGLGPGGPGSKPGAAGRLGLGRVRANPRNGTATLAVRVPGPGRLSAEGQSSSLASTARASKRRGHRPAIKPVTARVAAAGTTQVHLKPTPAALAVLRRRHRLQVKVVVTYIPAAGRRESASASVVLRLKPRPRRHG